VLRNRPILENNRVYRYAESGLSEGNFSLLVETVE
jgi:hypothetical protein